MAKISQNDFNKELDNYLSSRNTSQEKFDFSKLNIFSQLKLPSINFFKRAKTYEETTIDLPEEDSEELIIEEESTFEEFPEEKQTTSLLSIIKKFFQKKSIIDEETIIEELEELPHLIEEDVKNALKIQNFWLNKLTPSQKARFKASQDYADYKKILKKYNLIK